MRKDAVHAARRAAQRNALGVIVPAGVEVDLLRAILWTGPEGQEVWGRLRAQIGDFARGVQRLHPAQKGLLPLLHLALERSPGECGRDDATYLRAAYFREELRGHAYRRILLDLLDTLARADVPAIILKGCALADTVYPDPVSRHAHGIELLIRDADTARLPALLEQARFRSSRDRPDRRAQAVARSWRHARGLPLDLRTRLLDQPYYTVPTADLWTQSGPLDRLHGHARILCPEHNLLHVLASAAVLASRSNLRWACDAWFLVERHRETLNWPLFQDMARTARLALPLSITVAFLARDLGVPVPRSVLDALEADAAKADALGYEVALLGALTGAHARMRAAIARTPGLRARLAILRPLIAPSPPAVAAAYGVSSGLPLYYALRPAGYALRRLRRRGQATIRSFRTAVP